jgi:hypothetical protein
VAGLALSPDIDYIIRWLFYYRIEPRYTHSLGYCFSIGLVAWLFKRTFAQHFLDIVATPVLFLAPLSHLGLDLLVGVYPMPLFWPLTTKLVVLPFGILPSAGKLQWHNYYLWRNLGIELGILVPIIIVIIPRLKDKFLSDSLLRQLIIVCVFLSFVAIGIHLNRSI